MYAPCRTILKCPNLRGDKESSMNGYEMSLETVEAFRKNWADDASGRSLSDAFAANTLEEIVFCRDAKERLPFTFSIDLDSDGVCDQMASERCWSFTYLNIARRNVKKALDIAEKNFQMSHAFTYFYDQLEKSNQFMNRIIKTADRPLEDAVVTKALTRPISDFGYFGFIPLARKYGLVPKAVMPDHEVLKATLPLTKILSMKLRWAAKKIRDARQAGCADGELFALKQSVLGDIYRILCVFLGEPPKTFDFEYTDTQGRRRLLKDQTPLQFMNDYAGLDLDDLVEVNHWPDSKYRFNEMYYHTDFPEEGLSYDARPGLNMRIEDIKKVAIRMLRAGQPVIFGSDPRSFASKKYGYMDEGLFDYEGVFGTGLMMEKPFSHDYKWTVAMHMMLFMGVNFGPDGKPDRWKVQNSYGPGMGIDGHYVMSDAWFDKYIDGATLSKKFMDPETLACLEKEPIPLSGF